MTGHFSLSLLIFVTLLTFSTSSSNDELLVHLNNGAVRGKIDVDENGNNYYSFMGIPYAEPPVGHLRFRSPVPKGPWDSVLDATSEGSWCPQMNFITKSFTGDEDCLVIHVYTPKIPKHKDDDEKLHVLFHVHGGGFIIGSGGDFMFRPGRLMPKEKNFVIVSFNYRLGALGFLSTEDSSSPGNYGLLDQVEALRWVRNNIDRFGGDPNRVTIIGESAGGASVTYLMQSPLTKGLFHRAIALSGTSLDQWALQQSPLHWAKTVAARLNCPTECTKKLVNCLHQKTPEEFQMADPGFETGQISPIFTPTVDGHFILDEPYNIFKNKNYNIVPMMTGVTKNEGSVWFIMRHPNEEYMTEEQVDVMIGTLFATYLNKEEIGKHAKKRYLPDLATMNGEQIHSALGRLVTDSMFHAKHHLTVKMIIEAGTPTYVYSYDYAKSRSDVLSLFGLKDLRKAGAYHASELSMLFNGKVFEKRKTGSDLEIQKRFQKLILDFAIHGKPKSESAALPWPQSTRDKISVYHINKEDSLDVYDETKDDSYKFWVHNMRNIMSQSKTLKDEL